jgi:hypothetical protein
MSEEADMERMGGAARCVACSTACALQIPEATVRTRYRRARALLRESPARVATASLPA